MDSTSDLAKQPEGRSWNLMAVGSQMGLIVVSGFFVLQNIIEPSSSFDRVLSALIFISLIVWLAGRLFFLEAERGETRESS